MDRQEQGVKSWNAKTFPVTTYLLSRVDTPGRNESADGWNSGLCLAARAADVLSGIKGLQIWRSFKASKVLAELLEAVKMQYLRMAEA